MAANDSTVPQTWSQGKDTLVVPMSMHKKIRANLVDKLTAQASPTPGTFVLLQGGDDLPINDTDLEYLFWQDKYFHYLFGVVTPGYYGAIDLVTKRCYLFVPRLPQSYAVWFGEIQPPSFYQTKHEVDDAFYADEVASKLTELGCKTLLTLSGKNSDSKLAAKEATFEGKDKFEVDNTTLFPVLVECRVVKLSEELEIMRYINEKSSEAHIAVMKATHPGTMEYEQESLFKHLTFTGAGARQLAYCAICASGTNAAVLHYGHAGAANDKLIVDGDLCLVDMGAEYYGYASDITTSYPANGKFTAEQKIVYNAVLNAMRGVEAVMRAGTDWVAMQRVAYTHVAQGLIDLGVLSGDIEEMIDAEVIALFMPHGLGHFIGLDTHDVGGYPAGGPDRPTAEGFKNLRTARKLPAGSVITVEPGCYFIESILRPALEDPIKAKYINKDKLETLYKFGGVRLEDNVVVLDDGCEVLTKVPRSVEEIERIKAEA